MTDAEDMLAMAFALLIDNQNRQEREKASERRKARKKRFRKMLLRKKQYSQMLNALKFRPQDCDNYLRMNEATYLKLLSMVSPLIKKQDTLIGTAISPHDRLAATLRFLATGRTYEFYECLKNSPAISPQELGKIIPETCEALYKVLQKDYLQFPDSSEKWKEIAEMFENCWNFPHCLGAMGGKHIDIVPPPNSGCFYTNHKGRNSLVLVGIVDARYRFIMINFGRNGINAGGGAALQDTIFFERLQDKQLKIPNSEIIENSSQSLPYVFVCDDPFPLRSDMMKAYRQADTREKKIFNYRLSRVTRTVENAFGILASRFRIYHTQINLETAHIDKVVMATCALHNFLMEHVPDSYAPQECFYRENTDNGSIVSTGYDASDSNMVNLDRRCQGNYNSDAKKLRLEYQHYFVNEGKVLWQEDFVH